MSDLRVSELEKKYDERHGGPWDRGSADSYYHRGFNPHYFVGATYSSQEVTDLTPEELEAYTAGYEWNENFGSKKEW